MLVKLATPTDVAPASSRGPIHLSAISCVADRPMGPGSYGRGDAESLAAPDHGTNRDEAGSS
jgi:hypothetical protein